MYYHLKEFFLLIHSHRLLRELISESADVTQRPYIREKLFSNSCLGTFARWVMSFLGLPMCSGQGRLSEAFSSHPKSHLLVRREECAVVTGQPVRTAQHLILSLPFSVVLERNLCRRPLTLHCWPSALKVSKTGWQWMARLWETKCLEHSIVMAPGWGQSLQARWPFLTKEN